MRRLILVFGAICVTFLLLAITGCATMPQISKGAPNYLQTGMTSATLKGNDFYMAIGEVDLYGHDIFGNLNPTGKTVEIAVVIQADKDTGEVLKIATMLPVDGRAADGSSVEIQNGPFDGPDSKTLDELRGGISVIDIQPFPRWLDAIQAMEDASSKLRSYTVGTTMNAETDSTVVVVSPPLVWPMFPWIDDRHRRFRR